MYKSEKISFDRVFYCSLNNLSKWIFYGWFLIFLFYYMEARFFGDVLIVGFNPRFISQLFIFLGVSVVFLWAFFSSSKDYKLYMGLNVGGLYSLRAGWLNWVDTESIEIKKCRKGFVKDMCIFFNMKDGKCIRVAFASESSVPLDSMLKTLKEYHEKYGEK